MNYERYLNYLKYVKKTTRIVWEYGKDIGRTIGISIDTSDSVYPIQVGETVQIKELNSNASKSSARLAFVETLTDYYVLKTINKDEYNLLIRLDLINKLKEHGRFPTLISKIYLILQKNAQYWILMENIDYNESNVLTRGNPLWGNPPLNNNVSWKFDIKGSYINRLNNNDGKCIADKCSEGIDRDYVQQTINNPRLKLPIDNSFKQKLYRDVQFLKKNKLIDYSFILKITLKDYQYKYHVGIVDFLQTYTMKKHLEYIYKSLFVDTVDKKTITIQKPPFYGERFLNMIYCLVVENACSRMCKEDDIMCCCKEALYKYPQELLDCHSHFK